MRRWLKHFPFCTRFRLFTSRLRAAVRVTFPRAVSAGVRHVYGESYLARIKDGDGPRLYAGSTERIHSMRRLLSLTAPLAVLLILPAPYANANPIESRGFGCGGTCLRMFAGIHQHGPLFNYGPYYGYYPFTPYGPWDPYLRYDPFFYGDPYANWHAQGQGGTGNMYGWAHKHGNGGGLFHKQGCASCGFSHASWLNGGWFRGHSWLQGGLGHGHKSGCSSCGGVAVASPVTQGDPIKRYSGIGDPAQSASFYAATPTLDPTLEIVPTSGLLK